MAVIEFDYTKNPDWSPEPDGYRNLIEASYLLLDHSPQEALELICSPDGLQVSASGDHKYDGAYFGRDASRMARNRIKADKEFAKNVILSNLRLIGYRERRKSEEQRGRVAHENRVPNKGNKEIYDQLYEKWGEYANEMTYYGSVDATPENVVLVGDHIKLYGNDILSESVYNLRKGEQISVKEGIYENVGWIRRKLLTSTSGLLEFKRSNPRGIENQAWKDSREAYVHEDGSEANHDRPVASIEVQSLTYDALITASELFPELADDLKAEAIALRDRTIELCWMEDRNYFALGVDHDPHDDSLRRIKTKMANAGSLLNSKIFDDLPEDRKQKYISAIVETIMGSDFLTDAGIRSRALSMRNVVPLKRWNDDTESYDIGPDYHGSNTSWPKETHEIALGFLKQGFTQLAYQLWCRNLNAVQRVGGYPELFYVDNAGRLITTILPHKRHDDVEVDIDKTIVNIDIGLRPEALQGWTITAVAEAIEIIYGSNLINPPGRANWRALLEWEILMKHIPVVQHIKRREDLHKLYPELQAGLASPERDRNMLAISNIGRKATAV